MKRRAPLDGDGGRATSNTDLQIASRIVDNAGVLSVLSPLMDAEVGRHRTISLRGLLVAGQVNALARHHRAHLVEVARINSQNWPFCKSYSSVLPVMSSAAAGELWTVAIVWG